MPTVVVVVVLYEFIFIVLIVCQYYYDCMRNVIVVIVYGSISDSRSIPIARYILLIDCFRVRCSSCLKGCFSSLSVSPVDDTLTLLIRRCRVLLLIHSTNESSFIVHDSLLVFRLTRT